NTLVDYDYPDLVGLGRYPAGRSVSRFSLTATVGDEFDRLASSAGKAGASLVLSYSNRGLLNLRTILTICRRHFRRVEFRWISYRHSSQGRRQGETETEVKRRREYLVSCSRPT